MTRKLPVREIREESAAVTDLDYPAGTVAPGRRITLNFSLSLADDQEISSNFSGDPVTCVIGDGSLLPGFEQVLFGLKAGETIETSLTPARAFGEYNPDNVQEVPRYRFPPDMPLEAGLMIDFAGSGSYSQAGVVVGFDSSSVKVDFNHPLAGRTIVFRARIHSIGEQTG
jgi:FKBP-type peptidyl-prolyl cis-trans isomerase SlpA